MFPRVGKQDLPMITTAIIFDHRGRVKDDRPGPIEVRVTVDRKPYYIQTGIRVYRDEWKFGRIVDRPDCAVLNERLDIICRRIESIVNDAIARQVPLDVKRIKAEAWSGGEADDGAPSWIGWQQPFRTSTSKRALANIIILRSRVCANTGACARGQI